MVWIGSFILLYISVVYFICQRYVPAGDCELPNSQPIFVPFQIPPAHTINNTIFLFDRFSNVHTITYHVYLRYVHVSNKSILIDMEIVSVFRRRRRRKKFVFRLRKTRRRRRKKLWVRMGEMAKPIQMVHCVPQNNFTLKFIYSSCCLRTPSSNSFITFLSLKANERALACQWNDITFKFLCPKEMLGFRQFVIEFNVRCT